MTQLLCLFSFDRLHQRQLDDGDGDDDNGDENNDEMRMMMIMMMTMARIM